MKAKVGHGPTDRADIERTLGFDQNDAKLGDWHCRGLLVCSLFWGEYGGATEKRMPYGFWELGEATPMSPLDDMARGAGRCFRQELRFWGCLVLELLLQLGVFFSGSPQPFSQDFAE